MDMKNLRGILFDMDGVLVDSMKYHLQSWQELFKFFGIEVPDEFIFEHEGAMSLEVVRDLFGAEGYTIEEKQILEIYDHQNAQFQTKYLRKVRFYPETIPLLEQLRHRGLKLGLVTSSRMNLVEKIWNEDDLSFFTAVISADHVEKYKPFPEPYLKALNQIQEGPADCLVIENAPAGVQAATSAGISCFAIASTLPQEKLSLAQRVFPNLSSLSVFLKNSLF
jgi:beta-phosphoglucomutase